MTTTARLPVAGSASYASNHACPACNSNLFRTWRRPIDRFSSVFVPVHRYRCESFACKWEGNFRAKQNVFAADSVRSRVANVSGIGLQNHAPSQGVPKSFVLHLVLSLVGALFIVVFTTTNWFTGDETSADSQYEKWLASATLAGQGTKVEPRPQFPALAVPLSTGLNK